MFTLIITIVILLFGFVVFFGPPYLPTMKKQVNTALDLLDLSSGNTILELGSGDGRVARAAAKRGLKVVGIELNPVLVLISYIVTWRYRKKVKIVWGSYWQVSWPPADGIFTFMIGRQMTKLDDHIVNWRTKKVKLASFAFEVPGKSYVGKKDGIFLYEYN